MTFWALIRSIVLVCLCAQPIVLGLLGLVHFLKNGEIGGLFAVAATPMTLAFFGPPVLIFSVLVIVPTYFAFSHFGHREMVPFAVLAVAAGILLYLFVAQPAPSGAMPGYDQAAQAFTAATLVVWALYAFFRLDLQR